MGDFQLLDHLNCPISGLGFRGRKADQNSPCGVLGIESVGLTDQSPRPAVGPINFHSEVPVASDERGQPGAVGASPFDTEGDDFARTRPAGRLTDQCQGTRGASRKHGSSRHGQDFRI